MYVLLRSKNNQLQTEAEHRILVEILATKSSFLLILTILEDHNLPIFQISFCTISFWNCKLQSTRASLCPSFVLLKDINKPLHKKSKKKRCRKESISHLNLFGKEAVGYRGGTEEAQFSHSMIQCSSGQIIAAPDPCVPNATGMAIFLFKLKYISLTKICLTLQTLELSAIS